MWHHVVPQMVGLLMLAMLLLKIRFDDIIRNCFDRTTKNETIRKKVTNNRMRMEEKEDKRGKRNRAEMNEV